MLVCSRLPYHPYFRLQFDAELLVDVLADEFDELEGFFRRAAAEVYEVVRVYGGDLDPAYPGAFEAGLLYYAAWEISWRALEGGAAARPVGGAVHALRPELFYAGLQFRRVAGDERIAGP